VVSLRPTLGGLADCQAGFAGHVPEASSAASNSGRTIAASDYVALESWNRRTDTPGTPSQRERHGQANLKRPSREVSLHTASFRDALVGRFRRPGVACRPWRSRRRISCASSAVGYSSGWRSGSTCASRARNSSGRGATVAHVLWESPGRKRPRVGGPEHDRLSGVGVDYCAVREHETRTASSIIPREPGTPRRRRAGPAGDRGAPLSVVEH
jgi:hypothetical protein